MEYLTVRNWDVWQTYRSDRNQPPWIKLHRCLMRNQDWVALSDAQRGQLVSIWLLAADKKGKIPKDPQVIKKLCYMDGVPDIELFIKHGFIDRDATTTPPRRQDDPPDKIRLDQTRLDQTREEKKPVLQKSTHLYPDWLDQPAWEEWKQHRAEIKNPMTPLAETKGINKLKTMLNGVTQRQIIDHCIANGWKGLFAPDRKRGTEVKSSATRFKENLLNA